MCLFYALYSLPVLLTATNSPRFRFTLLSELLDRLVLRADPTGWDQLGVSLHRDPEAHGLSTEYSLQLGFVKAGRAYLARAYAAAGIEADVRLLVEQYDPNAFAWLPYYTGRVNLTSAKFSPLDVKANVENENFTQKFLNRADVQVDLLASTSVSGYAGPISSPTYVELHSRVLAKRFTGEVPAQGSGLVTSPSLLIGRAPATDELSQTFYFGYATVSSNELGLELAAGGFVSGDAFDAVPIFTSPDFGAYVVEFGGGVEIRVRGNPNVPLQEQGSFRKVDVKLQYRLNADPRSPLYELAHTDHGVVTGFGYQHTFTIPPQSFPHELKVGDQLYLYAEVFTHDITRSNGQYQFQLTATVLPGTYLRIRANTQTAPTAAAGLLAYEAFDRLASALSDESDAFRSSFYGRPDTRRPQPADGAGALTLVTGGFQVRGFPLPASLPPTGDEPDPRKSLFASWNDLFGSFQAVHGLGYGQERTAAGGTVLRVEPMAYFYPPGVVLDLRDRPVAVTTTVAKDRHYQGLEFGYSDWQAEQVNGLQEANAKRQWTTPLTQVATTYSQLSKYATSGQLLEVTRRQRFVDSNTTDNRSDNRNFLVCLVRRPDGSFDTERDQSFTLLAGVLDPASLYNARLTPARMLQAHGALVRAGLEPAGNRRIRFSFGEGNNAFSSQLRSEAAPVAEGADLVVAELPAPLWRAETDGFTTGISRAQVQALLAFPHGRIRYRDQNGRVREGWVLDFKHLGPEQLGEFTLLPCADIPG